MQFALIRCPGLSVKINLVCIPCICLSTEDPPWQCGLALCGPGSDYDVVTLDTVEVDTGNTRAGTCTTGQGVQCGPRLELVLGYSQHCEYCGAVTPRPALLGPARPARPGGRRHKSRRLISLQMHLLGAAANTGDCSSGSRSLQHAVLLGPTDGQHISSCREQSVLTYTTLFTFNV